MSIKGELTTERDDDPLYPWTATFTTENYGEFYGYGETERQAITDVEHASQGIINQLKESEE